MKPFRTSGLLLLSLAAAGAVTSCSSCRKGGSQTPPSEPYEFRAPMKAAPAQKLTPAKLRVLHFGDFGDSTPQQSTMAQAMAAAHQKNHFDMVFSAGDNVYDCGPDAALAGAAGCNFAENGSSIDPNFKPPEDPLFAKQFEKALEPLVKGGGQPPGIFLVLGNHDIASTGSCAVQAVRFSDQLARVRACLEVAHRSPEWFMPGRHYVFDRDPARFIAIDSNLLTGDYAGFSLANEAEFVRVAAAECAQKTCFIVAHHPPVMAGTHAADVNAEYQARVAQIEAAAGGRIAAWLVGHDHDLQHLRAASGYDVLISGNTSRGRPEERFGKISDPKAELLYGSTAWGYGVLEVSDNGWSYRFENQKGEPTYCCTAPTGSPCQPVACKP